MEAASAPPGLVIRVAPFQAESRSMWLFIAADCPRCGRPRGEGEPWSYRDGVRFAAYGVTHPCGHHESYADLVVESRGNARVLIEDDSNPFITVLAREYHVTTTRWLCTQPEDAE